MLEAGMMGFGKDPGLEWKPGGERGDREKRAVLGHKPVFLLKLLSDDIAEDTTVFIVEIGLGSFNLLAHPPRDDGKGDDLRVGMFQRGSCCDAVVLENKDVSKTLVSPEIDDPVAVGQQDILHIF